MAELFCHCGSAAVLSLRFVPVSGDMFLYLVTGLSGRTYFACESNEVLAAPSVDWTVPDLRRQAAVRHVAELVSGAVLSGVMAM